MHTKTLILGILHFQDATGYEIRKLSTDGPFSFFADISFGSIYPILARLETEKLVTSRIEREEGKPERKVFSITERGRESYCEAIAQPPAMDKFKSEFLLVAMSAEFIPRDAVERAIDERIAYIEGQIATISEHVCDCEHEATNWISDYGRHVMREDVKYLRRKRNELLAIAGSKLELPQAAE